MIKKELEEENKKLEKKCIGCCSCFTKENKELKKQIEKMKNCGNCKNNRGFDCQAAGIIRVNNKDYFRNYCKPKNAYCDGYKLQLWELKDNDR